MTYLWVPALPIRVNLQDGRPQTFYWNDQQHRVQRITRTWRIDVEWWKVRIWRDTYKLVTDSGLLVVIYHDLLNDGWYLQQLYD